MRDSLREVLLHQRSYAPKDSDAMVRRGQLIRKDLAGQLRGQLDALSSDPDVDIGDLRVEARDATGLYSEIPWARIHSLGRSPSATIGWYVVYLFDAPGDNVYLCLMQGTSRWQNNQYKTRPLPELRQRVEWARKVLDDRLKVRPDLTRTIKLNARGKKLAPGYEAGTVAAFAYPVDALPSDDVLSEDLRFLLSALSDLYGALDQALDIPGEPAPEIAEVIDASERAALRRGSRGQGRRLSAEERSAIERRAMDVA
ncbi:MrcB family domain-containing protein, partial [Umezawaea sp.]|uniref:MrcB family domain-containing protein n=1 Tax=Umezawaea sp. TaxID=1955258 RepID=UPI002ED51910